MIVNYAAADSIVFYKNAPWIKGRVGGMEAEVRKEAVVGVDLW